MSHRGEITCETCTVNEPWTKIWSPQVAGSNPTAFSRTPDQCCQIERQIRPNLATLLWTFRLRIWADSMLSTVNSRFKHLIFNNMLVFQLKGRPWSLYEEVTWLLRDVFRYPAAVTFLPPAEPPSRFLGRICGHVIRRSPALPPLALPPPSLGCARFFSHAPPRSFGYDVTPAVRDRLRRSRSGRSQ